MARKPKKFAVPWSISVSKEMHDRARQIQQVWHKISIEKFDRKFSMSDLGVIALEIGLEVVESLPKPEILDTMAKEEISEKVLKIEVRKARRYLKAKAVLSSLTDEDIESMIGKQKGANEE